MSSTTQRTLRGDPRGRLFVPDPVARSKVARKTRSDSGSDVGIPSGAVEFVPLAQAVGLTVDNAAAGQLPLGALVVRNGTVVPPESTQR